jgi:hypothetical protein
MVVKDWFSEGLRRGDAFAYRSITGTPSLQTPMNRCMAAWHNGFGAARRGRTAISAGVHSVS